MKIQLIATGPDLVGAELDAFAQRVREPKPVLAAIQKFMLSAEDRQFATHGERGGTPWPEDTEEWQRRKAKAGHPTEPEEDTDALRRSLTKAHAPGGVRRLSKQATTIGTRLPQGAFARRPPRGGRPRREVDLIRFTDGDITHMGDRLVNYLLRGEL